MDKSIFDKYINEMKQMSQNAAIKTVTTPEMRPEQTEVTPPNNDMSGEGYLLVNVTSIRSLYPVKNAKVTIFKGNIENMQKLAEGYTDESGKTELFPLPAPPASLAQEPSSTTIPFVTYNMLTEADGFVPTINYNAPVFDKITSLQNVNLLPKTVMNGDDDVIIIDEYENYPL